MAHHQENNRRHSTIQNFLKMLHLSSAPETPLVTDEDVSGDADEPPDDLAPLPTIPDSHHRDSPYTRSNAPRLARRESLLTRALNSEPESPDFEAVARSSRGVSSASNYSNASVPSTADLTSDGFTSPARTTTPSPPPPPSHYSTFQASTLKAVASSQVVIASTTKEPTVEANLGRKRCISFACGRKDTPKEAQKSEPPKTEEVKPTQPPKRKCMLTFACPSRTAQVVDKMITPPAEQLVAPAQPRLSSPAPSAMRRSSSIITSSAQTEQKETKAVEVPSTQALSSPMIEEKEAKKSEATRFHEFASSHEEDDAWVHESLEHKKKITVSDCMMKENAIRKLGEEAEQEARQEEEDEEALDDDVDEDEEGLSDIISDDGNESDNEAGFAESDDEDDAESEYSFWAPANTTAATSVDHFEHIRPTLSHRRSDSSIDSTVAGDLHRQTSKSRAPKRRRPSKVRRMRPSTPDLPDSTDFVCGTLDEDRPLEAAYMSCLEQRRRAKHVLIPQDIDPSFPTSDPEDNDNDDMAEDATEEDDDHLWLKDQLDGFEDEKLRNKRRGTAKTGASPSPKRMHSPPPSKRFHSPPPKRLHSPPPKRLHSPPPKRLHSPPPPASKQPICRSPPPPRRLFGSSPKRARSPPPALKLHSPPGTRRQSLAVSPTTKLPLPLNVVNLAQRPGLTRTKSLPRTPNPFFKRFDVSRQLSTVSSMATSPNTDNAPSRDVHVRGPIDIAAGLEKKRQKRKEKYWRQHCRKYAKEQQERKTIPGKGAERMKELGLECAERTKAYGQGQQAQVVISL